VQTHHKLAEALDRMIQLGALDVGHSLQPSLVSRQYVKSLTGTGNGEWSDLLEHCKA